MNRREFLGQAAGATVTLILTPTLLGSCSSNDSSGSSTSTEPTLPGCDGVAETSTVTEGHTHSICVSTATLTSPPAGGATLTTTSTEGHAHVVAFTQAMLQAIEAGATVSVTTSVVEGHTHGFSVRKGAVASPPITRPIY